VDGQAVGPLFEAHEGAVDDSDIGVLTFEGGAPAEGLAAHEGAAQVERACDLRCEGLVSGG